MHDNAFEQFMNYLDENNLIVIEPKEVGQFSKIENEFYIFDIEFYKRLFDENGFVTLLKKVQESVIDDSVEE